MRYTLLGRSGLRVSEVALGTMTFGEAWGWGASEDECRGMFEAFVEAGGNFVDTASNYTDGQSESIVGALVEPARDRFVVATKYTLSAQRDDPNAGGNHRKNLVRTLETSLRRLRTDYVDLLWLHMWDGMTPVAEVVRALDDLVSSGKVLHVGISDTPAWVVSQAVTLAELRGWSPFVALQAPYSLADRDVERELLPMAQALGLTFTPWGMLEGGATHREVPRRERRAAALRRRRPEGERAGTRGGRRRSRAGGDACTGSDRVGARAAVAHGSDRRRPDRVAAPREPRRARGRARARTARPARCGECVPGRVPAGLPRVGARPRAHLRRHVRAHRRPALVCAEAARDGERLRRQRPFSARSSTGSVLAKYCFDVRSTRTSGSTASLRSLLLLLRSWYLAAMWTVHPTVGSRTGNVSP